MKKLVSVCVFILALVTGVFAMAREPVYGVMFIPKKEYTLEKGKFKATVPQVQAVSFIDGRTPVNECSGAAKAVNKQLRAYVDKAYQDYQKEGEPGTWVYPMITKNGDNIYSLVMVKQILHGQLDVYMDEAFTFLQNTGKRVSWKDIVRKEDERFMTVEYGARRGLTAAFRTDIVRQKCPALTASMWMIPISLYLCSPAGRMGLYRNVALS